MLHMSPSAGDSWYHIPSPAKQKLKQVSVGRTSVCAVDENGKVAVCAFGFKINYNNIRGLYSREPMVPTGGGP